MLQFVNIFHCIPPHARFKGHIAGSQSQGTGHVCVKVDAAWPAKDRMNPSWASLFMGERWTPLKTKKWLGYIPHIWTIEQRRGLTNQHPISCGWNPILYTCCCFFKAPAVLDRLYELTSLKIIRSLGDSCPILLIYCTSTATSQWDPDQIYHQSSLTPQPLNMGMNMSWSRYSGPCLP